MTTAYSKPSWRNEKWASMVPPKVASNLDSLERLGEPLELSKALREAKAVIDRHYEQGNAYRDMLAGAKGRVLRDEAIKTVKDCHMFIDAGQKALAKHSGSHARLHESRSYL